MNEWKQPTTEEASAMTVLWFVAWAWGSLCWAPFWVWGGGVSVADYVKLTAAAFAGFTGMGIAVYAFARVGSTKLGQVQSPPPPPPKTKPGGDRVEAPRGSVH